MRRLAILATPCVLSACVAPLDQGGPVSPAASMCDATRAEAMIGRMASTDLAQRLLAATGASQLRWAPPRTAMTMDFRPNRLTVAYDDAMAITQVTCG